MIYQDKNMTDLPLSTLNHTWILNLDGTLVKHNGYKIDGKDTLLPGAADFLRSINDEDKIILLTSRTDDMQEKTEMFLRENGIRYDVILYNIPYGERILINDCKPSGLRTAIAISKKRDAGMNLKIVLDERVALERSQHENL